MPILLIASFLLLLSLTVSDPAAAKASNGTVDNNPGNLEDHTPPTLWAGRVGYVTLIVRGTARRFVHFISLFYGVRALMINTLTHGQPGMNLRDFGEIWAPTRDNPGATLGSYGDDLGAVMGVDSSAPFDFAGNLIALAQAIVKNERGVTAVLSVPPQTWLDARVAALSAKGLPLS